MKDHPDYALVKAALKVARQKVSSLAALLRGSDLDDDESWMQVAYEMQDAIGKLEEAEADMDLLFDLTNPSSEPS